MRTLDFSSLLPPKMVSYKSHNMYDIIIDTEVDLGKDMVDPSPYNHTNALSGIGWKRTDQDVVHIHDKDREGLELFKTDLASARYAVFHNAKFDLSWLRECGIEVTGKIICTMISEHILNRGQRKGLSLKVLAEKYELGDKSSILAEALSSGGNWSDLPLDERTEYLTQDVRLTEALYNAQLAMYTQEDSQSLIPIRDLMCEFCSVLTDVERTGMQIDLNTLSRVDREYEQEEHELRTYLTSEVHDLMGDLEVNLASPAQLSQVIYSCRLTEKAIWKDMMNIGTDDSGKPLRRPRMKDKQFQEVLRNCFVRIKKVRAVACTDCKGFGKAYKIKKDGSNFAKPSKCLTCEGRGSIYIDLADRAGLDMKPSLNLASAGGFKTDKKTLEALVYKSSGRVRKFITSLVRLSAIETYRASFIGGILRGIKSDNLLHTNFNQCIAATSRLSSSGPNMQNMPRAKTFPVRQAFVSRFHDGEVIEVDYSQLEFRVAGILARDDTVKAEVENGFDVHSYTAKVLTDNGEATDRTGAKPSTFRPLYGGTQGTAAQMVYFVEFFKKYTQIFKWHEALQSAAVTHQRTQTATGRQFDWPNCERTLSGNANYKTQIVNYPVQSVATADIVPLGVILLNKKLRELNYRSCIFNTVHDSVLVDCPPEEVNEVVKFAPRCLVAAQQEAFDRFGLEMFIPLACDVTRGKNWMDQEKIS